MDEKAIVLFITNILFLVIVSGCTHNAKLPLGVYSTGDDGSQMQISIEDDNKFVFSVPVLSIMPSMGSYKIDGNKLILSTDNQSTVVFKIEENTLKFDLKSSSFSETEYPDMKKLSDGEIFVSKTLEKDVNNDANNIVMPELKGLMYYEAIEELKELELTEIKHETEKGSSTEIIYGEDWIIKSQDPIAGTMITKTTQITLVVENITGS